MLKTYGLTHINIPVKHFDASVRFYRDLFGMKEIRRFDKCVMLRTPGSHEVITIMDRAEEAEVLAKSEGFHFGFRLPEPIDMNKVMDEITHFGGKPLEQGGSKEKGRLFAFAHDPNGYTIEVFWEND